MGHCSSGRGPVTEGRGGTDEIAGSEEVQDELTSILSDGARSDESGANHMNDFASLSLMDQRFILAPLRESGGTRDAEDPRRGAYGPRPIWLWDEQLSSGTPAS